MRQSNSALLLLSMFYLCNPPILPHQKDNSKSDLRVILKVFFLLDNEKTSQTLKHLYKLCFLPEKTRHVRLVLHYFLIQPVDQPEFRKYILPNSVREN